MFLLKKLLIKERLSQLANNWEQQITTCLNATTMGTHVPYGITQCYLLLHRGGITAFTQADLSTPEGCKADLTCLVGYIPPKDGHPSQ